MTERSITPGCQNGFSNQPLLEIHKTGCCTEADNGERINIQQQNYGNLKDGHSGEVVVVGRLLFVEVSL